jgi:peptidyl-prolyl cis-trans isomerase SurA
MTQKMISSPVRRAAFVLSALACLAATPALAASTIRVLVNDQPITSYDIQQRTKMLRVFTGGKAGEKEAIDQLIDEKLMLTEAKARNIEVSDAELDQEVARRAESAKMSVTQFGQALRQAGIELETFKQFLRANMAWSEVVRARFRATVNITDQDITAALGARTEAGTAEQAAVEYMVQPIFFMVPEGASNAVANESLSQANAFREGFRGCDQSLAQVGGAPGIVVRPIVRREEAGLPPAIKEALAATEVGGTTKPARVPEGYQILAVCAKNTIAGQTSATVTVREELNDERGKLLARRYLRDLRSDAVIEYR